MRKNIYKLPHSKSTYRLNFLYIVVWLSGHGVEATYLTASSEQPTHSSVDWAQQPWLAASIGEGQLRIETRECQVCWTGLTGDQGSGPVLWTYTLPPSTSLPVMVEIAGVNTASLSGYLRSTKTRARWAERFHELKRPRVRSGDGWAPPGCTCPRLTMR